MKRASLALVLALLAAAAAAAADEATLFSARAETAAEQPRLKHMRQQRYATSVTAVAIDPRALDAEFIAVTLDGTAYRFKRMPAEAGDAADPTAATNATAGSIVWRGLSADPSVEALASFTRNGSSVSGQITTARRQYDLWPAYAQWPDGGVLVRKDGVFDPRPAAATN